MKTTERFDNAYKALHKAFMEGTLGKRHCAACACGNIIAEANNCRLTPKEFAVLRQELEFGIVRTVEVQTKTDLIVNMWKSFSNTMLLDNKYLSEINHAGYTGYEFILIEMAFEKNTKLYMRNYSEYPENDILNDQFNGLMAVLDVLMELDNIEDNTFKESFKEHPKLVLIEA